MFLTGVGGVFGGVDWDDWLVWLGRKAAKPIAHCNGGPSDDRIS